VDTYEALYSGFDSPLMRQVRSEAYGEDIGQHSWVGAGELRADIRRLGLSPSSRLLDLGSGPCGPLTFVLSTIGCSGMAFERSAMALRVGRARASSLGIDRLLSVQEGNLEDPLPFESHSFDAAMSLDVVLHLRDRGKFFSEVARVLARGGRFLMTDAGVVTGSISSEEVLKRSLRGYSQFVAPGFNERMLESAGFRVLEVEDRTPSVTRNASGRLAAIRAHRAELERADWGSELLREPDYLETVIELARRGAVSRMMYLTEVHPV
jgi:sarcosine/dimethylglycine N-methyltransferase